MSHLSRLDGEAKLRMLSPQALRFRLVLPAEHRSLLERQQSPSSLLKRLQELGLLAEQASLYAYALPERESVWWGCMCVAHTAPDPMPAEQGSALLASEEWVRRPGEENRRQARAAAKAAGGVSAPAFVARAAFAARLATPDSTHAGRMIEGAIRRAAAPDDRALATQRLQRFIASAEDIANGGAGRLPRDAGG